MVMLAFLVGSLAPWLMGYLRGVLEPGQGLSYAFAGYGAAYVIGGLAVGIGLIFFFKHDRIVEDMN
jgi:hypothetical protein